MKPTSFKLAILAAASAIAVPLAAHDAALVAGIDQAREAQVFVNGRPAQLAQIDFRRFFLRAAQLGVPAQSLGFSLNIASDGEVTDCTFSRRFRHAFTAAELCDQIKRTARFRPAVDAQGHAVASIYENRMDLQSWYLSDR
jgi:hypothetical protein